MDFNGSKTRQNLIEAFIGESKARNKYTFYAQKARKDGFCQIADIFEKTAQDETEHAKIWFRLLHNDSIPDTIENLKDAIESEHFETSKMYVDFAKIAQEEGFERISKLFHKAASIEKTHEERYRKLLENIEKEEVFEKNEEVVWECDNCGFSLSGREAPEICPFCAHPRSYFMVKADNY